MLLAGDAWNRTQTKQRYTPGTSQTFGANIMIVLNWFYGIEDPSSFYSITFTFFSTLRLRKELRLKLKSNRIFVRIPTLAASIVLLSSRTLCRQTLNVFCTRPPFILSYFTLPYPSSSANSNSISDFELDELIDLPPIKGTPSCPVLDGVTYLISSFVGHLVNQVDYL